MFNGNNADDLFAKFEEKIQMNNFNVTDTFSTITNDTNNNNNNFSSTKDFDPFGGGTSATTKNDDHAAAFGFDTNFSFEANFDDDNAFDKMNDNFSNNDITNSMKSKIKPHVNGSEKKKETATTFSEDYSTNFDMDLKSALERSVIDK